MDLSLLFYGCAALAVVVVAVALKASRRWGIRADPNQALADELARTNAHLETLVADHARRIARLEEIVNRKEKP